MIQRIRYLRLVFVKKTILIIDNTAFAMGFNINLLQESMDNLTIYSTHEVYDEASKNSISSQNLEIANNQGILSILEADETAINIVKIQAKETGDYFVLSEPDISLIALAYQSKQENPSDEVFLMSDDYAIQNVCRILGIEIYSMFKTGIKKIIYWEIYCPSCFRIIEKEYDKKKCPNCHYKLKRRPKRQLPKI